MTEMTIERAIEILNAAAFDDRDDYALTPGGQFVCSYRCRSAPDETGDYRDYHYIAAIAIARSIELERELATARERIAELEGCLTDRVVHYRNLALELGATPQHMLNKFDKELAEKWGRGQGYEASDQLENSEEAWDTVERLEAQLVEVTAERDAARKLAESLGVRGVNATYEGSGAIKRPPIEEFDEDIERMKESRVYLLTSQIEILKRNDWPGIEEELEQKRAELREALMDDSASDSSSQS